MKTKSKESKTSIFEAMNRLRIKLIIGLALVASATVIFKSFSDELTGINGLLDSTITLFVSWGSSIVIGMLMAVVSITILRHGVELFWHHYLKPPLDEYSKLLSMGVESHTQELSSDIGNKLQSLTDELSNFQLDANKLLKDNLLESVVSRSGPEYLTDKMNLIHEKAYGSHCSQAAGLYGAISNTLYPFLDPKKPHRSQHNQTIVVSELDDKIIWKETSQFEVHTIAFDDTYITPGIIQKEPIEYLLKFKSGGNYVDLDKMVLEISVDGETIVSLKDLLIIRPNESDGEDELISKDAEILTIAHDNSGFVNFLFHKTIEITKRKILVKVHEESYLSEEDNFYVAKREEPTYSSTISITLPPKWTFYNFTVPDETKWGSPNKTPFSDSSSMVADINDWVLPGIIISCNWCRPVND